MGAERSAPIGVFDSGIGGQVDHLVPASVLRRMAELRERRRQTGP